MVFSADNNMKLLGIDYGTKRIGLATGDTEVSLAFPLRTIPNDGQTFQNIITAIKEEGSERIVLGVPIRLSGIGNDGETEKRVASFLKTLEEKVDLPIDTIDERMTTVVAEKRRHELGLKKEKVEIDAMAAAVVLEMYMDGI